MDVSYWRWLLIGSAMLALAAAVFVILRRQRTHMQGATRALKESNARFSAIFHSVPAAITITRLSDGRLIDVNSAFVDLWGYTREEVVGREHSCLNLWMDSLPQLIERLKHSRSNSEGQEVRIRRSTGESRDVLMSVSLVQLGDEAHLLTSTVDITGRKHAERMEHLAHYDTLTELPNRLLLGHRLKAALDSALAQGHRCAILFIDLDRFKDVNDTLGHEAGDELLKLVSSRLRARTRGGDFLARLGGDEFVVVLADPSDPRVVEQVAADLIEQLSMPFVLAEGRRVQIGASIGISYFDGAGTADVLMRRADMALYAAKRAGRNGFHIFREPGNEAPGNEALLLQSSDP